MGTKDKDSACEPGLESSPDTECAGALILDVSAFWQYLLEYPNWLRQEHKEYGNFQTKDLNSVTNSCLMLGSLSERSSGVRNTSIP